MINIELFKNTISEKGKSIKDVYVFLNIDSSTLYRKMIGESDFYREEIKKICELLEIEDPKPIFFDS